MKLLETLITLCILMPVDLKTEVEFTKVQSENQYARFDSAIKNKKDVCYVIGDSLTVQEYLTNKDKYVFIFFPVVTKDVKDFANTDKGIIIAKYNPTFNKTGQVEVIGRYNSFPKAQAGCTSGCAASGCVNCSKDGCTCATPQILLRPSCPNGNCTTNGMSRR